jgi:lactate 2-monooxygenase
VCIGRPYAYALAIAGEAGVRELLANLIAELDLVIGLTGHRSVGELGPDALAGGGL